MFDIVIFILDLLFKTRGKKENSKEAENLLKHDSKNLVNILIGGISGLIIAETFLIAINIGWGDINIGGIIVFGVPGALGGILGRALANRINESKLSAIIGGAIGGILTCGFLILLFMYGDAG